MMSRPIEKQYFSVILDNGLSEFCKGATPSNILSKPIAPYKESKNVSTSILSFSHRCVFGCRQRQFRSTRNEEVQPQITTLVYPHHPSIFVQFPNTACTRSIEKCKANGTITLSNVSGEDPSTMAAIPAYASTIRSGNNAIPIVYNKK